MSSYVTDKSPNKYGEFQSDYNLRTQQIVKQTADNFHQSKLEGKNLNELFYTTLADLGEERHKIAVDHGTKNSELFGKKRTLVRSNVDSSKLSISPYTALYFPYESYNSSLLLKIQEIISEMTHTKKEFTQIHHRVEGQECLGRNSRIDIQIFNERNKKVFEMLNVETCVRLSKLCDLPPPSKDVESISFINNLLNCKTSLSKLKKSSPEDYLLLKINKYILETRAIEIWKEWKKSDWVHVTVRLEIDGKLYSLSQYLTWMYRDFKEDPVKHMSGKSGITIIHQDEFLIDDTLKDVARLFEKVITLDSSHLKEIKQTMTLIDYELAHAMPFSRGSSAVSEWLEQAIYLFHGYKTSYDKKKYLNLEALTSLLPEFAKNYDSLINLEKIDKYK